MRTNKEIIIEFLNEDLNNIKFQLSRSHIVQVLVSMGDSEHSLKNCNWTMLCNRLYYKLGMPEKQTFVA